MSLVGISVKYVVSSATIIMSKNKNRWRQRGGMRTSFSLASADVVQVLAKSKGYCEKRGRMMYEFTGW